MPVKTMAIPCSSAAFITSSSRTLPPGWMIAVAPASAAASTPSLNGKKASEASTVPLTGSSAFATAIFEESTRDIWPAPIPTVWSLVVKTIAEWQVQRQLQD